MPNAIVDTDQRIFYLDQNSESDACVLLLHGLGANSDSWLLQIPDLVSSGFRVVAPDTPGFGKSPSHKRGTTVSIMVQIIIALLRTLNISNTSVVGISMGGVQALQIALDYPQYVSKLVLVNSFSSLRITDLRVLPYMLIRAILINTIGLDRQARLVAKRVFPHPDQHALRENLIGQINQADIKTYRDSMRALASFNVTARLPEINAPTLVITGEQDTTVPANIQEKLVKRIPSATQITMDAGHAASVEDPHKFNQILIKFLLAESKSL